MSAGERGGRRRGAIVAISSTVSRGTVGLRATQFALERRGHEVWPVPTIVLPWHPGLGPSTRLVNTALGSQLEELTGSAQRVAAITTGYFASAQQVMAAARFVERVKRASADVRFFCDPVSGDSGGRYVADDVAEALKQRLLPLADLATPNATEALDLAGRADGDFSAAAQRLGPAAVVVTSVPAGPGRVGAVLYEEGKADGVMHEEIAGAPKGTGDLFLGVLVAATMEGASRTEALAEAAAATLAVVERSRGAAALAIAGAQEAIASPPQRRLLPFAGALA